MSAGAPSPDLRAWIGRTETHDDLVTAVPAAALAAAFDRSDPFPALGDALQPLRHWLYFLPLHKRSEVGADGHPRRGGFLPPIALPRRMWAGSRLRFAAPLRVGAAIRRVSTITDISEKTGRSGGLAFVTVRHRICAGAELLVDEEHDIVYRDDPPRSDGATGVRVPPAPATAAGERACDTSRAYTADEVLLFRYSALTFNGHRIHYDRRYVTEVEGYPGLVVHGPLLATLLADLAGDTHPAAAMTSFAFRALAPVFDGAVFRACAAAQSDGSAALWIATESGTIAMEATATFARA